jgi:hypothetical protein
MAEYRARMMDAEGGQEGVYDFKEQEDLLQRTPMAVVRSFFQHIDRTVFERHHVDYEINAAQKHRERGVVVAMGQFHLEGEQPPIPFTLIIGRKSDG